MILVDNKKYLIVENEGCGGCGNGWSSIKVVNDYINKPIKIKTVESNEENDSDEYKLIINGDHVADVDTGWGNGYYGGDFEIELIA